MVQDGHCSGIYNNEKLKTAPPNQKELGLKKNKNPDKIIENTENADQVYPLKRH